MKIQDPKRIRKLMLIQEISQRELCTVIGWKSHSYLGRILRGEIKTIDPDAAVKIAATLGVGIDDLFLPQVSTVTVHNGLQRESA